MSPEVPAYKADIQMTRVVRLQKYVADTDDETDISIAQLSSIEASAYSLAGSPATRWQNARMLSVKVYGPDNAQPSETQLDGIRVSIYPNGVSADDAANFTDHGTIGSTRPCVKIQIPPTLQRTVASTDASTILRLYGPAYTGGPGLGGLYIIDATICFG